MYVSLGLVVTVEVGDGVQEGVPLRVDEAVLLCDAV